MMQAPVTRRAVLRTGAAGVALLSLPLRLVETLTASAATTATNTWTYSQFSSLVGSNFRVTLGDGSTTQLKLAAAQDLLPGGSSSTSTRQCFALSFSGGLTPVLGPAAQNLYNPKIGPLQLLLVAGQRTSTTQHYIAIVNRL